MKVLLRNWLLLINIARLNLFKQKVLTCLLFLFFILHSRGQVVNYVNNGGFELLYPGAAAYSFDSAKFLGPIDTNKISYVICSSSVSIGNAPYVSTGFQYPRSGNNFILTTSFCDAPTCTPYNNRLYPRNRLKQVLKPNTEYCAKYYVVNTNDSPHGISNHGIYFGSSSIDTIKYCKQPLAYLTPQVQNGSGLIIDTLNWVPISGTFTAVGNEKYMVLGNFNDNPTTNTVLINPAFLPNVYTDVYIDDISLIELNLPAFAGRDTFFIPGDSIYLGRPSDVGIDEACQWYKLPNTTTAVDTIAGFWLKPTTTCTYVVKQEICGIVKWDTIILYQSAIGFNELGFMSDELRISPNPNSGIFNVEIINKEFIIESSEIKITNILGQEIGKYKLQSRKQQINLEGVESGIYYLQLLQKDRIILAKKIVKQ